MNAPGLRLSLLPLLILTGCLLAPAVVDAQPVDLSDLFGGSKKSLSPSKAVFTAAITPETLEPGDEFTLSVTAKLPAGHYIYGIHGKVNTVITATVDGAEAVSAEWTPDAPGKTMPSPEFGGEITKHHDQVTWTRTYKVLPDATAVSISGKLEGQYCAEAAQGGSCYPVLPPYRFELTASLGSEPATEPASELAIFDRTIRPNRAGSVGAVPAPISYRFRLDPADAQVGDTVLLSVTATPDEGWHTYSLTQSDPGGAPTEIVVTRLHHLEPLGDGFEPDHPFVLEETAIGNQEVYQRPVTWSRSYRVTAETAGDYGIAGDLTFSVCDSNSCLPTNNFDFHVGAISGPEEEPTSPFATVVEDTGMQAMEGDAIGMRVYAETLAALDGVEVANAEIDRSLIPFLLLCVGGGLLALLTPCAFPMVPITVSFFLKQSEQNHKRPWLLALVYCTSIVLAFTILGVGISAFYGATKLTELANNPWINVVIALVFVAFGLNMLGAFEIRVPTSLLTWSAMHEGGGNYLAVIFMALTFTLTSFTCTFAVAGSLLVMASQGSVYWPVIGMLAFGTAFASPFFILALLPGMLKKLPKSGGWMNSVKVVMGLIEMGAAVKFFSIADLSWNPSPVLFDYVTSMMVWMVLAAAIGAYLLGWYRFSHDTPVDSVSSGRGLLAISFFGLATMLGFLILQPERASGVMMEQIVAFAPPRLHGTQTDMGPTIEHHGIQFALDLERARPVAQRQQRPLLLDFTGVNCVNCRLMEQKMGRSENKERMQQFVNVQLYADRVPTITNPVLEAEIKDRNLHLQTNWFGNVALPSYAVVSPDGQHLLAAYIGNERKEGEFTRFLDYSWKRWEDHLLSNGTAPRPVDVARNP